MKFPNKSRILLVSPESWNTMHLSKHHYAIELAKQGAQVYFLNPPSTEASIEKSEYKNLFVINYQGHLKGLYYFPRAIRKYFQTQTYRDLEKKSGVKFDIIWSFDNSVFYDFDALQCPIKISHIVDENMDFQFERAARSTTVCFGSSDNLVAKLKKYNSSCFFINHGYSSVDMEELDLPKMKGLKIGYAGNLGIKYLDWGIIERVVKDHPLANFIFAGSGDIPIRLPNITTLGVLSKNKLASFLSQMDVLIIAYLADDFPHQVANPHKMLEYLSTGKPIIATLTKQYQMCEFIAMSRKNKEYPEIFKRVIDQLDEWNGHKMKQGRINLALQNTYETQIERIAKLLAELKD